MVFTVAHNGETTSIRNSTFKQGGLNNILIKTLKATLTTINAQEAKEAQAESSADASQEKGQEAGKTVGLRDPEKDRKKYFKSEAPPSKFERD